MNGYHHYSQSEYTYWPDCPYRSTCPIRTECPYCPYQMEGYDPMNSDYNVNMNMEFYMKDNANPIVVPYQNVAAEEYGYDNLYPVENNTYPNVGMGNYGHNQAIPQYNELGYINPEENIHSPWDNNRMYGENN